MRLHLPLAILTIVLLVISLRAHERPRFTFEQVEQQAEKLMLAKYVPPPEVLPPQLKKLTPQQDAGIFWKDTYRLWRKKGLPFQVDFYHPLNSNPEPHIAPRINTVDRHGPHLLGYSSAFFNFLNLTFDPPLPANLGYAGFYLRYPDMAAGSKSNSLDGFFSVLGSSYFRAIAKGQTYGLSARGLAINTSLDGKSEEFPLFTEWWLNEPEVNATEIVLDAILDSPSVVGAYEFKVRPGAVTSVTVHGSLFFRKDVDRLGIAPFSSMYLYGENAKNHFGDNAHQEVHDSDGVLIQKNNREWVWRPLGQATQLQFYPFPNENLRGFGLIQRDRDFQHYQDLAMNYNVRPSAWVTPRGNWGKGEVTLIHRPTSNVNFDNVVLFWHPDKPVKAGDHMDINYTIDFYMNDAQRPPLAYCKETLINDPALPPPPAPTPAPVAPPAKLAVGAKAPPPPVTPVPPPAPPSGTTPVQFLVDFIGNGIENIPANEVPHLEITTIPPLTPDNKGTYLREFKVEKNGYDNSWRVSFTLIPFKHNVPTEILCRLIKDGKPLTETWSYTWHQ